MPEHKKPTRSKTRKPRETKAKPVPAAAKKVSGKKVSKKVSAPVKPRRLAARKKQWYNPSTWRAARPVRKALPKARAILRTSIKNTLAIKKTALGITIIYGCGVVLLVRGFSATQDFTTLKNLLDSLLTGSWGKVQSVALQLTLLFGGSGTSNTPNGGIYQTILLVVCSLAAIWALRQGQAKNAVSTRLAFYRGMYPLIPFLAVLLMLGIQLLPLTIGSYLYSTVIGNGIAVQAWEKIAVLAVFLLLAWWSLRMLTGSIFALYVVTLPEMTPLRAIRSAKKLVAGRRLQVWRKLIVLPVVILLGTSFIILPFLLFLTPIVVWVFFILSTLWFVLIHGYLYTLYRELLND